MTLPENEPLNSCANDEDFTLDHYRELLAIAKSGWKISDYKDLDWNAKFIIWRHDVDYSLNCSLKLAQIENQLGVKSTYFVNPHSKFYNIAESSECKIINEIISLGHDIGLHFEATFYSIKSELDLQNYLAKESLYLQDLFKVVPTAFSFHDPVSENLKCDAEEYSGLKNCYSKKFKEKAGYCSDSNGYWRFRRMYDLLKDQSEDRIQILTHPGWWHEKPMPPRQRVHKILYERAESTMQIYDKGLEAHGRLNIYGKNKYLNCFKEEIPHIYRLYDYLWNANYLETLFLELWRQIEAQINRLCIFTFINKWNVSNLEIRLFFEDQRNIVNGFEMLNLVFYNKKSNFSASLSDYKNWQCIFKKLLNRFENTHIISLENNILQMCIFINDLANLGLVYCGNYSGLIDFHHSNTFNNKNSNIQNKYESENKKRWNKFLFQIKNLY